VIKLVNFVLLIFINYIVVLNLFFKNKFIFDSELYAKECSSVIAEEKVSLFRADIF